MENFILLGIYHRHCRWVKCLPEKRNRQPSRCAHTSRAQSSPAIANDGNSVTLTWATTIGVKNQVEWSPDLAQWFPIGTPNLAATSMTWTDDGSQNGSPPIGPGKRFYRLRLSE